MAKILKVQTKISIDKQQIEKGNTHPICVWATPELLKRFENCLELARTLMQRTGNTTSGYFKIDGVLHELKTYNKEREQNKDYLPQTIEQHISFITDENAPIEMRFNPLNNVPTEAILLSFNDVIQISDAISTAMMFADNKQQKQLNPFNDKFKNFFALWKENRDKAVS